MSRVNTYYVRYDFNVASDDYFFNCKEFYLWCLCPTCYVTFRYFARAKVVVTNMYRLYLDYFGNNFNFHRVIFVGDKFCSR